VVLEHALAQARRGDEAGFATLWRSLQPPLLRYLAVRARQGGAAPEDIAGETWLQVVKDLDSFTGGVRDFRAWLFTIARHRAIDAGRAGSARPAVPMADPGDSVAGHALAPSAEQQVVDRDATDRALALVRSLPPLQAEMVMLRVVAGLDVRQVADLVGKNPGTVRVAVHRALRTLARDPRVRSVRGDVS
jgi:RNA polymerase sigma-70 factor (ECF subfamily)